MEKLERIIGWIIGIGFCLALLSYCVLDLIKPHEQHMKEVKQRREHPKSYVRPMWED